MKPQQLKALHASVLAMFSAFTFTTKSDRADYDAVAKFLKAAPLNDADAVKAIRDDLLTTFGDEHKDAAQIRINIVNNARRIAFGGTKDGKTIRGKGVGAMLEIVATVASVRELKKALAENVPEALKGASGGDTKSGKGKAKVISVPAKATREQAFTAARKVLEFVRDKFTRESEIDLRAKMDAASKAMEHAPKSAPADLKAAA